MYTMEKSSVYPDYAKDIRLNLDAVLSRSSLTPEIGGGRRSGCAFAAKDKALSRRFESSGMLNSAETQAARTAAALMR